MLLVLLNYNEYHHLLSFNYILADQGPSNKNMKQIGIKVKNESVCEAQVSGFEKYKPQGVLCAGGEKMQDTCTVSCNISFINNMLIFYILPFD